MASEFLTDTVKFLQRCDEVMGSMRGILTAKMGMRGISNLKSQGLLGIIHRVAHDKMARVLPHVESKFVLEYLRKHRLDTTDARQELGKMDLAEESLEDDLMDIANYCVIAVALLREGRA